MKKNILDIEYLDTPIEKDGWIYYTKVNFNIPFNSIKSKVKNIDSKYLTYSYGEVVFSAPYGNIRISKTYTPYIDSRNIWIRPDTKYLRMYTPGDLSRNLSKEQIYNIVKEFNKILIPCCNQIRLCKKCLTRARSTITY